MDTNIEEADNITKNIVQEIVRECTNTGLEVDENFCAYYVKLLTLDPLWKISPERKINRENIQRLVNYSIEKLLVVTSPNLITMKIQQYFLSNVNEKINMTESHRKLLSESVEPLREDIVNFVMMEGNKAQEHKLFRRITLLVTLLAGLGNPKHYMVFRDATYALRSVFNESEIRDFGKMKKEDKVQELVRFQHLVTGIRLFNRDCGKPAAEIEDVPKLLLQALGVSQLHLHNELGFTMEQVNLTTTAIQCVYVLNKHNDDTYNLVQELPESVTQEVLDNAVNMLTLFRQYEIYLRKMISDVEQLEECSKQLFSVLRAVFAQLHQVIKFKIAVPVNVVYPLFIQLSETWQKIQDEAIRLSLYNQVYQKLYVFVRGTKCQTECFQPMVGDNEILSDLMRLEQTMGKTIKIKNPDCKILDPASIKDFDQLHLQYLGFCIWSLVETNGGLIPGNPSMGVCKWDNRYYVFASLEAAATFGFDPNSYVKRALDIARNKPELINLLQLHSELRALREVRVLYEKQPDVVLKCNVEVQTDLHPIPTHIDPDYKWNIWDFYREAIKLANICNCRTHSFQTKKSHFRYGVHSQTTEPRDKMCQTRRDNYTNVATPSNFIYGLRGRRDDTQHIIELTRPIDEKKFYECATTVMENAPVIKKPIYKCRPAEITQVSTPEPKIPEMKKCKYCNNYTQTKLPMPPLSPISAYIQKNYSLQSLDESLCNCKIERKNVKK